MLVLSTVRLRVRNELFNTGANWRSSINVWSPEGQLWSPKISPPFFSNKSLNMNKKCMVWTFLCSKIALLSLQITESNHTCTSEVLFFFLNKLLLGDIKLSNLENRSRKLSVHDCTDHIKTLLSSDKYHETRNINTSQAAMLLVPGHNCATLLVPVHKVHNVLTVFQLKTTWRLGNVQFVLIVAVVKVLL